jgi:hypothetical protein
VNSSGHAACDVCCKNLTRFSYCYRKFCFKMHSECALLRPTVSYKGHRFLLLFLEKIGTKVDCKTSDTPCDSPVFHCAECDFNLHLLCGPLPCTIGHEYYMIPFSLQILHAKIIHISSIVMPVRRKETQGYHSITARITTSLPRLNLSCPRQVCLLVSGDKQCPTICKWEYLISHLAHGGGHKLWA